MVIVYGYRNKLKVQKNLGASICPNCGYNTEKVLAKEKRQFTLFYLPIFSQTVRKGLVCPNCGMYKTLDNSEFRQMSL